MADELQSTSSPDGPTILFSAFEPSGDAHAAPVIRALRHRLPDAKIFACGGDRMQAAGATIIERTTDDAAMGLGALARVSAVRRTIRRLRAWSRDQSLDVHVLVDSPAANFPLCKALRHTGAKRVHLVAPQLWAWGGWRIRKLRRLTDLVLCLLPFEEAWFNDRNVPARFIGHPIINRSLERDTLHDLATTLPQGGVRIGVFPGSRSQEIDKNLALLVDVCRKLQNQHPDLCAVVAAARPELVDRIRNRFPSLPANMSIVQLDADAIVYWADLGLTVSGTMSLNLARQRTPMIGVYRINHLSWMLSKLLLKTPHRLLPNIIAGDRVVPEFVPYAGGPGPIVNVAMRMIDEPGQLEAQREALERTLEPYRGKHPDQEAAELIASQIDQRQQRSPRADNAPRA